MIKIIYRNQFNEICTRHGSVQKQNGIIIFLPNDTTKKIEIPKEKFIDMEEVS